MNSVETIAIAKIVKEDASKAASKATTPGEYQGEFLAKIIYAFKKGEDYEQKFPAKANPWLLLGAALSKLNGITVEALVREANGGALDTDDLEKRANAAIREIKEGTVTRCNGKINGTFAAEIIPTSGVEIR